MGFMDKVKFWKKNDFDDDLGLGADTGLNSGAGSDPFGSSDSQSAGDPFGDMSQQQPDPFGSTGSAPSADPFGNPTQGADPFGSPDSHPSMSAPPPPGMGGPNFATQPPPRFQPQPSYSVPPEQQNHNMVNKDIEIISSKLDALRVSLDMINQRLSNIERMSETASSRTRYRW